MLKICGGGSASWVWLCVSCLSLTGLSESHPGVLSLSPDDLREAGLHRIDQQKVFTDRQLHLAFGMEEGVEGIIREGGLLELRQDSFGGSAGSIRSNVFHMVDSKAAYSAFTFWRPAEAHPVRLGDGGIESQGQILFWQSDYIVRLAYSPALSELDRQAMSLARAISKSIGIHQGIPPLAHFLPAGRRIEDSERYILGDKALHRILPDFQADLLGFKDSIEIAASDYRLGSRPAKLLLVDYPTMALARSYFANLGPRLRESDPARFRQYFTKRSGAFVAILIGDLDPESASRILDKIKHTYTVKWIYRKEPPPSLMTDSISLMGTVVYSIFLTGLISLGSVAGGLVLGGSRFMLRMLRPNNFLDKPERAELVRLKLNE